MNSKDFPIEGNLGYGPNITLRVGEDRRDSMETREIVLRLWVGGETNGVASIEVVLNYFERENFTLVDSLIKALEAAKLEVMERSKKL